MISRKSVLLLLIPLSNPSIIFSQLNTSSINGSVLDAKTGEPIPSVNGFWATCGIADILSKDYFAD